MFLVVMIEFDFMSPAAFINSRYRKEESCCRNVWTSLYDDCLLLMKRIMSCYLVQTPLGVNSVCTKSELPELARDDDNDRGGRRSAVWEEL